MPDMLVKLYDLPATTPVDVPGVTVRRPMAPEKHLVLQWVMEHFGAVWTSECDVAFSNQPISCYIAIENGQLIGFACYDASCLNFFGPTGVQDAYRGRGVGKLLLLKSLLAMKEKGYAYAVIGAVGPADFYGKTVNATIIVGSDPGVYNGVLKENKD